MPSGLLRTPPPARGRATAQRAGGGRGRPPPPPPRAGAGRRRAGGELWGGRTAIPTPSLPFSRGGSRVRPARSQIRSRVEWGAGSAHRRINISGIRCRRQRADPGGDLVPGAPLCEREDLLFADRGIESRVAERTAGFQAGKRDLALNRGELEGKRGDRVR